MILAMVGMVVAVILGFVAMMVVASVLNGYVLTKLWGWFIVPTFHVPVLHLVPAMGLAMVVSYLTYQIDTSAQAEKASVTRWVGLILNPLVVLAIGWVLHKFM